MIKQPQLKCKFINNVSGLDHKTAVLYVSNLATAQSDKKLLESLKFLRQRDLSQPLKASRLAGFTAKKAGFGRLQLQNGASVELIALDLAQSTFEQLTLFGKWAKDFATQSKSRIIVKYDAELQHSVDYLISSLTVSGWSEAFEFKEKDSKPKKLSVEFYQTHEQKVVKNIFHKAYNSACATNHVRALASWPTNELTPKLYREKAQELAKLLGLKTQWIDQKQLVKRNAGAFLAVCRGSGHQDSGILKIEYRPKTSTQSQKSICLVGKGICFDTGGVHIKPARSMSGMNADMTGSALVLAFLCYAQNSGLDYPIDGYLAIADNRVSADSYLPNEVVSTVSGRTIEIVHTDAEGRMVLADTLTIATETDPDLCMCFATLTGSAVGAIGTQYSAAFTKTSEKRQLVDQASEISGERCWNFPLSEDYGEALQSDFADTKQCMLSSSPDHIEAAYFLSKFCKDENKLVHIDLSACENDSGLAHVRSKTTGFGVRFIDRYIDLWIKQQRV